MNTKPMRRLLPLLPLPHPLLLLQLLRLLPPLPQRLLPWPVNR